MFRRILSLLMILLLPVLALAEISPVYQVSTFSGRLPEALKEPLSSLIPDESRILSGALIRHNGYHVSGEDGPAYRDCLSALVLVNADDGLRLYAAAQPEGQPWVISDYTRILRQGKNVSVSVYQPESNRIPVFSVDYAVQGGMMSDQFVFWGNMLWCVYAHSDEARGITIKNDHGSVAFTDAAGTRGYACLQPFYLDYMEDLSAFPITREAAERCAIAHETAFAADVAANRAYAGGANLRTEPTGKSESLGVYASNTPMLLTGKQEQGVAWPWYQVQIGNTVGWMSSNYVNTAPYLGVDTVPLGRVTTTTPLCTSADDQQHAMELPAGASFHILTEYKGMYHICIPQGEISWAVDRDGVYGYIPMEGVLTGYSPSALDAQEIH